MFRSSILPLYLLLLSPTIAQDTFSIAAVDPLTGEVGSAGASCVNLFLFNLGPPGFLAQQLPGVGTINTQAAYVAGNQNNAMARLQAGDEPDEIISWLESNDVQGNAGSRQYGIVKLQGSGALSAAYTGASCLEHAGHRVGPDYSIQGNILLGPEILDAMETNFTTTQGTLADKLMAALQGANVVGADTRCTNFGTSSLFAFLEVAQPNDPFDQPSLSLGVQFTPLALVEPIDTLQALYDLWLLSTGISNLSELQKPRISPNPAVDQVVIQLPAGTGSMVLEVQDVAGRTIGDLPIARHGDRYLLSIQQLAPGLYQIRSRDREKQWLGRFIKQ